MAIEYDGDIYCRYCTDGNHAKLNKTRPVTKAFLCERIVSDSPNNRWNLHIEELFLPIMVGDRIIEPRYYFITTGDCVPKLRRLIKDLIQIKGKIDKVVFDYAIKRAIKLLVTISSLKKKYDYAETRWYNNQLQFTLKRKRETKAWVGSGGVNRYKRRVGQQ